MTQTYVVIATRRVQEKPTVKKPDKQPYEYPTGSQQLFNCYDQWQKYENHVLQLKQFPLAPSCADLVVGEEVAGTIKLIDPIGMENDKTGTPYFYPDTVVGERKERNKGDMALRETRLMLSRLTKVLSRHMNTKAADYSDSEIKALNDAKYILQKYSDITDALRIVQSDQHPSPASAAADEQFKQVLKRFVTDFALMIQEGQNIRKEYEYYEKSNAITIEKLMLLAQPLTEEVSGAYPLYELVPISELPKDSVGVFYMMFSDGGKEAYTVSPLDKIPGGITHYLRPASARNEEVRVDEIDETNFKYPSYIESGGGKKWDDMTLLERANYDKCKYLNALAVSKTTIKRLREKLAASDQPGKAATQGQKEMEEDQAAMWHDVALNVDENANWLNYLMKTYSLNHKTI